MSTVTVESLYILTSHLREGDEQASKLPPDPIWVRLRTATIAHFKFRALWKIDGRYQLLFGRCRNNPRYDGGIYPPVSGERLIDVEGMEIPDHHAVPVRGFWDLHLSDLDHPYGEDETEESNK